MTWYPIALLPPQFVDSAGLPYSGAVLKAYQAETSNVLSMATSFTGGTTATSFALNASGYPVSGGNVIIPHVQENFKLALYPTQSAADLNSGAIWTYDDIQIAVNLTATETLSNKTLAAPVLTGVVSSENSLVFPQGRLSLSSTLPVHTADITAVSSIYYLPYIGNLVPIWDGTKFVNHTIPNGTRIDLDSNSGHTGYHQSGKNFDVFAFDNAGTAQLITALAWSSDTARAAAITQKNGIWVNNAAMVFKTDATSFTATLDANKGTYLGTFRATANGQTGMAIKPAAASGGSANILGLYNAYNRVRISATCRDSTASWTYASTTWRSANNNAANRISFVDGLQQSSIDACYQIACQTSSTADAAGIGTNLDSTSATPNIIGANTFATNVITIPAHEKYFPQIGFHYIQAMEAALVAGTATYNSGSLGAGQLTVSLDM